MACSLTELIFYVQHREDSGKRTEFYDHLSTGCPDCSKNLPWVEKVLTEITKHRLLKLSVENLRWLETVLNTAAEDQSFQFSEETIAAIIAKFIEQTATTPKPIRQYIAELIFEMVLPSQFAPARPDSAEATVPAEAAVSEDGTSRRAIYRAAGYDVDLIFVFSDENNNERLVGQIIPDRENSIELPPFKIELLQNGSLVSATNTNVRGVFNFVQLISGTYNLKVSVPEGEISLERVLSARVL